MINRIFEKIGIICINAYSLLAGMIYNRSAKTVLIGAWMGEKFADNSRYLFQYLSANKNKYDLKNVVWVTRNEDVRDTLDSLGYQVCLIGTKESKIWHLKAGIHILCNTAFPLKSYDTDIDTRYSFGAKKIQLWHGVGFKAVGMSSNEAEGNRIHGVMRRILDSRICSIMQSHGGWTEAKVVATSLKNGDALQKVTGCRKDRILLTGYPRHCECPRLLPRELKVISYVKSFESSILYLPTFRSDVSHYTNPLENREFVNYLNSHNILWIEKPHSADKYYNKKDYGINNVLALESDFDINVLYIYLSAVMSDYSSAVFDAIRLNIPVIMYTPDLDIFKNGDVGFLFDIEQYCAGLLAYTPEQCKNMTVDIIEGRYYNIQRKDVYRSVREDFFGSSTDSLDEIWNKIDEC